jgi:hypothetical protein
MEHAGIRSKPETAGRGERQKAKANAAIKRMPHPMTAMGTGS